MFSLANEEQNVSDCETDEKLPDEKVFTKKKKSIKKMKTVVAERTSKQYRDGFFNRRRRQQEVAVRLNRVEWEVVLLIWSVDVGRPRFVYFNHALLVDRWGELDTLADCLHFMTCYLDRRDHLNTGWSTMNGTVEMVVCQQFHDWFVSGEWQRNGMAVLQELNSYWRPNIKRVIEVRRLGYSNQSKQ